MVARDGERWERVRVDRKWEKVGSIGKGKGMLERGGRGSKRWEGVRSGRK